MNRRFGDRSASSKTPQYDYKSPKPDDLVDWNNLCEHIFTMNCTLELIFGNDKSTMAAVRFFACEFSKNLLIMSSDNEYILTCYR